MVEMKMKMTVVSGGGFKPPGCNSNSHRRSETATTDDHISQVIYGQMNWMDGLTQQTNKQLNEQLTTNQQTDRHTPLCSLQKWLDMMA